MAPYRLELVDIAERLEARTKQKRWTARTDVLLERDFVVGAYVMQKLLRTVSAPDRPARRIPVRRLESDYDLALSRRDTITVADLCHHILDNTVFDFHCGETADLFDGIYVAGSGRGEQNVILVIASDFIALCNDLGTENA